jgi:TorA maturation chaperone TorD
MNATGAVTGDKTRPAFDPNVGAALARDLRLLIRLHDREADAELFVLLADRAPDAWFGLRLAGPAFDESCRLMTTALADVAANASEQIEELASDFAAIYLTHGYRVSPNESVWRDEEGLERQGPMFSTRAWYKHFGVKAPDWRIRADDHLVNELQFLALLLERAADDEGLRQAARFLREHPLVWIREFSGRVVQRCRTAFYASAALMTAEYLDRLAAMLGALLDEDMTPAPLGVLPARAGLPAEPTCADAPPQHNPAVEPSW